MNVIIKPILTEKLNRDGEILNRFGLFVNNKANKIEIKKAVEASYNVTVLSVNTINVRSNRTSKYTKKGLIKAKSNAMKKAFVQVKDGEKIDFYKNI